MPIVVSVTAVGLPCTGFHRLVNGQPVWRSERGECWVPEKLMGTSDVGLPGVEFKGDPRQRCLKTHKLCRCFCMQQALCDGSVSIYAGEAFLFFCYKSELLRVQPFWVALCQEQKRVASWRNMLLCLASLAGLVDKMVNLNSLGQAILVFSLPTAGDGWFMT